MIIQTIPNTSLEELQQCFNEAFSEYFVPVQVTKTQLKDKFRNEGIDLSISIGAFEQGKLVGFILHGTGMVNGHKTAYNAGTGVIKACRGQGVTRKMYEFCLPILRKKGFQLSVLEAIVENAPAIKVYESVGFKKTRTVHCFRGAISSQKATPVGVTYRTINLPDHREVQSWWSFQPTWQNSWAVACRNTDQYQSVGTFLEDELVGYISFHPQKGRIQQIGVRPENRREGIASGLIRFAELLSSEPLSVINVDEKDHASLAFYVAIGLEEIIGQIEMQLSLG